LTSAVEGFAVNTPDIVDAVKRASRVAPKSGSSFDTCQGLQFEIQGTSLVVKASDGDTNYRQQIPLIKASTTMLPFRLPSRVLASYMGQLPTGEGSVCEVTRELNAPRVAIATEVSSGQFGVIVTDGFPQFTAFAEDLSFTDVEGLADQLGRVSWACSRDSVPLDGVHFDGEWLVATNRSVIARVRCPIELEEPVTAPLASVASALTGYKGPVRLAISDRLHLSPDDDIEVSTTLYTQPYPDVQEAIERLCEGGRPTQINRDALIAALGRIISLVSEDRYTPADFTVDGHELRITAEISSLGRVEEVIVMEDDLQGEPLTLRLNPKMIRHALESAGGVNVTVEWPESEGFKPVRISNGSTFEAVVMIIKR